MQVMQKIVNISQVQHIDKGRRYPSCVQRQVPSIQKIQKIVEILQVRISW